MGSARADSGPPDAGLRDPLSVEDGGVNTGAFDRWCDFKERTLWEGREVYDATLGNLDFTEA